LNRTLYVALARLVAPREALAPHLAAHLQFMIGLEETGTLFASGPFFDPNGVGTGEGMSIVRASSREDAAAVLSRDPFVMAGLRTFELHEWHIMEGALHVTVLASQQRGVLP
jgi:uncharacterized protein YciI